MLPASLSSAIQLVLPAVTGRYELWRSSILLSIDYTQAKYQHTLHTPLCLLGLVVQPSCVVIALDFDQLSSQQATFANLLHVVLVLFVTSACPTFLLRFKIEMEEQAILEVCHHSHPHLTSAVTWLDWLFSGR